MITASLGMPQIMAHIPRSVAKYLQFSFAAVVQRPSVINSRSTALFRLWFARYTATIFILKFASIGVPGNSKVKAKEYSGFRLKFNASTLYSRRDYLDSCEMYKFAL